MACLRVALGVGDSTHGHEPPVSALGHRRTLTERRCPLQVSVGAVEVSDLEVDLADPHVQVGGGAAPRDRRVPRPPAAHAW